MTSAAIIVLAISITSTFSIVKSRNIILSNTMEKELPAVMGELANSINTDLQVPIVVSRVMANNEDSKRFLLGGEKNITAMSDYLAAIKTEFNATSSYYISDATGNYYTSDGILTKVDPNNPAFSWFYSFKASNNPFAIVMNTDDANNKMTLLVNYRVEINGKFKGLTGI